jgi:opacity protein-like surface antigen
MKFIFALLAAAGLVTTPAFAADGSGFYVGAGIGDFGIKLDGESFDANDFGFKVFGGYNFIEYLGVEVEYIDGGSPSDHGISIDMYGFNFSAVGIWPVTEQFDLFAKAGFISWDAKAHGLGNADGEDFSWGVGAGWDFTDQFGIRGEYQGFEIEDTDSTYLWSASVLWRF